jgi:hypothetical protein
MSALVSPRNDFVNSLLRFCTAARRRHLATLASRYGPESVRAIHLVCRSPGGDHFDLVAIRGFVVAPEAMRRLPGLWWLQGENYPRLVMEDAKLLEDAIGSVQLGCWPYCVAAERWNEAAAQYSWLPRSPASDREPDDPFQRVITDSRIEAVRLPRQRIDRAAFEFERASMRSPAMRLQHGLMAVAYLFGHVTRGLVALLTTVSLAACAYYLAAVASWLWGLGDGMGGPEMQDGIVLILAGVIAWWITGHFAPKRMRHEGVRFRPPTGAGRDRQPLLHLALDAYRVGVVLQLLAFAGFVVM